MLKIRVPGIVVAAFFTCILISGESCSWVWAAPPSLRPEASTTDEGASLREFSTRTRFHPNLDTTAQSKKAEGDERQLAQSSDSTPDSKPVSQGSATDDESEEEYESTEPVGMVRGLKGKCKLVQHDTETFIEVEKDDYISLLEGARSEKASKLWLELHDWSYLSLGESSLVAVNDFQMVGNAEWVELELSEGIARFYKDAPASNAPSSYIVRTPLAVIEVRWKDQAADFVVEIRGDDSATVTVFSGEVKVGDATGQPESERALTSCQAVDVIPGKPSPVRTVSSETIEELIRRTTIAGSLPEDVPTCEGPDPAPEASKAPPGTGAATETNDRLLSPSLSALPGTVPAIHTLSKERAGRDPSPPTFRAAAPAEKDTNTGEIVPTESHPTDSFVEKRSNKGDDKECGDKCSSKQCCGKNGKCIAIRHKKNYEKCRKSECRKVVLNEDKSTACVKVWDCESKCKSSQCCDGDGRCVRPKHKKNYEKCRKSKCQKVVENKGKSTKCVKVWDCKSKCKSGQCCDGDGSCIKPRHKKNYKKCRKSKCQKVVENKRKSTKCVTVWDCVNKCKKPKKCCDKGVCKKPRVVKKRKCSSSRCGITIKKKKGKCLVHKVRLRCCGRLKCRKKKCVKVAECQTNMQCGGLCRDCVKGKCRKKRCSAPNVLDTNICQCIDPRPRRQPRPSTPQPGPQPQQPLPGSAYDQPEPEDPGMSFNPTWVRPERPSGGPWNLPGRPGGRTTGSTPSQPGPVPAPPPVGGGSTPSAGNRGSTSSQTGAGPVYQQGGGGTQTSTDPSTTGSGMNLTGGGHYRKPPPRPRPRPRPRPTRPSRTGGGFNLF
ncbi:FecR domain-containing protein [Thermodesulfobacteriota bacterium]